MPRTEGSQRHLLHLLDRPDFLATLNALLARHHVSIKRDDIWTPRGAEQPQETQLPKFCRTNCSGWFSSPEPFRGWWIPHRGMLPTWDLISTCEIGGKKGVLLVEAKAHESELHAEGKAGSSAGRSRSAANHREIATCIEAVARSMRERVDPHVRISIDRSYQLSNRVAWAWRLAEHGGRVALLYLGFLGDTHFKSDHFVDEEHWQRTIAAHMAGCLPLNLPGRRIELPAGGSFQLLLESIPVPKAGAP